MVRSLLDIALVILVFAYLFWWWLVAKKVTSRTYVRLTNICWITTVLSYMIAQRFGIVPLFLVSILGFLGTIIFFIKVTISEHAAKKKSLPG